MTLFRRHTIAVYKADLEKRASSIAATLSEYMSGSASGSLPGGMTGGRASGYGVYIRFLSDIAMTDAWIVDENLQLLTTGPMSARQYQYADLPQDADAVVKAVFTGSTTFSEGFSGLLDTPTLTVGMPIWAQGKVVGALLLHAPVEGMTEAAAQGAKILGISLLTALALSVLLSAALALAFAKPLQKMKTASLRLAAGDYTAKTGVKQTDEIGELAAAIDVLSERLDAAQREGERLDQLRRDFVANISHELRTPVTVIRGSLEALCDGVVTDPGQVRDYYRQMRDESQYLQRLINDLLDLSRLQNTDFHMDMRRLNLCDVLGDAVRSAGQMARGKDIDIRLETDAALLEVTGDYGRLRQMLLIVLDNAVKFSPPGASVAVSLKERTVSVRDRGQGIASQDLPHIFDRFYKARSEDNKSGSGLGLAIAKQIADRHGIAVSADSNEGGGSEFKFSFPQDNG
jgi:signal transduction histidine kinase